MLFQYYYSGGFGNAGYLLQQWGIFDVILPFLLVYAIVYAALKKVEVLKEDKINRIVSLVVALSFIAPHIGAGTTNWYVRSFGFDPVVIVNTAIPQVGVLAVAVTLMLILAGLVSSKDKQVDSLGSYALYVAIGLVALIFAYSLGWFQSAWLSWIFYDPSFVMIVLIVLAVGIALNFIGGEEKK